MLKKNRINNPDQVSLLIYAQATYYPNMISVYIPKQPIVKHGVGYEDPKRANKFRLEDDLDSLDDKTNIKRSLRRTKKIIRDYVLCNKFDMFITFTFKSQRHDISKSRQRMADWLKNQRNRNGRFRYLIIPEFHKKCQECIELKIKTCTHTDRPKALHFHALFGDYPGKIKQAINSKTNKLVLQKGKPIYTLTGYTLGFNNVKLISNDNNDDTRISAYIQKYIVKDMPSFSNKHKYWASKGLLLPNIEDNPELWYRQITPDWTKECENGKLLRFNINKNALVDIFWEQNQ